MIYDCFLYYDEDMLLDIRLNTLADVVDYFVIVESTHTFTGKPKKLNFDMNKFKKYKEKIIYIIFDEKPYSNAWKNEADTRNAISRGLKAASDKDLILVSDVDEIYNPEIIKELSTKPICTIIKQHVYNYQFNLQIFNFAGTPRCATLPKATSYKNFRSFFRGEAETLRNTRRSPIKKNWIKWKWYKHTHKVIERGGWHFSWIMTPERISEKMSSISHTEYDLPQFNNPEHIIKAINNAEDIWSRERIMEKQKLATPEFPEYLVLNKDKFKKFILE